MASATAHDLSSPELLKTSRSFDFQTISPLIFLGALWFILCRHLSNEWSANEQYSYGWFVPFFAAYLFGLRWETKGKLQSRKAKVENASNASLDPGSFLLPTFSFLLFAALLPLRLFEVGNPDWRPLGWLHSAIVVGLTLTVIKYWGGKPWVKHFAFPICFIFVAVPWVTPIEEPIVQGLMRIVAAIASEAINLLGIPAQLEGSVIRISSGVVGVNEACSGVRSLQTSIMAGLLFGELKRLSLARRFVLVGGAIAIAFAANCARAFLLVWIAATRNIEAVAQWHDLAGYAILFAVFLGTIGLAASLGKGTTGDQGSEVRGQTPALRLRLSISIILLAGILAIEAGVEIWYRAHERDLISTPAWTVQWPQGQSGFRELKIEDGVKSTLRYDYGRQVSWPLTPNEFNQPASVSMFFFRWEPGATSILRARAHRPDICLPNTGWRVIEARGVEVFTAADGLKMPFRHFIFARPTSENRGATAHAFFCQREDRIPRSEAERFDLNAGATSDWSRSDRVRVVREGLRNQGQQVLEIVMLTPKPLESEKARAEFARLVPQLVK